MMRARTTRMKYLAAAIAVTTLALFAGTGKASATVTYTPGPDGSWPGTWFVGRGDVISNFGKAALVPNLAAEARFALTNTVTCTYPDGTVRSFSGTWTFFRWGDAQPRYAPGSDLITGYFAGPDELWHGDDAGAQFYSDLGCPAPGSNNPYLNDPAIPRTAVDTGTSSFYVNGRLLFGPELIYGPVPHT